MNTIDNAIKKELIIFYQKRFGHKWYNNIHKQLIPSPFRFLSVVYNVPIDYIKFIYNQLIQEFNIKLIGINASL
jgi:hypothetical protein